LYFISAPWNKTRPQQQKKVEKICKHIETEKHTFEWVSGGKTALRHLPSIAQQRELLPPLKPELSSSWGGTGRKTASEYVTHLMILKSESTSVTVRENKNMPEILKFR
jgi:hypothetical protein